MADAQPEPARKLDGQPARDVASKPVRNPVPTLTLIAALDANGLIGRDGALPWHLPDDLKRFKQLTLGHIVLMGRKTWLSLGRPLPGRDNWVLTRDPGFAALATVGARGFDALDAAFAAAGDRQVMVIGGAELYRQTLPLASRLELTRLHAAFAGDTWFPAFDAGAFVETARTEHPADARHVCAFSFVTLERP